MTTGPLTSFYESLNRRELEAAVAVFAAGFRYEDVPLGDLHTEHKELLEHFRNSFEAISDFHFEVLGEISSREAAAAEVIMSSERSEPPFRVRFAAYGRRDSDGRITTLAEYWNRTEFPF